MTYLAHILWTWYKWWIWLIPLGTQLITPAVFASTQPIHHAPIILKAQNFHYITGFSIDQYRLIKNENGVAKIIPFQIDEQTHYTDFILTTSVTDNPLETGDGVFNFNDELVYMGQDTGTKEYPKIWNFKEPDIIYRVDGLKGNVEPKNGSVFVAVYPDSTHRPPLSTKRYVDFDLSNSAIITSKYRYEFDPKNYMVVRNISLFTPEGEAKKFVDKSSFYLKSDFKYFLTFKVGHSDLKSTLEAYKVGPIRTVVRVSFSYIFLRLNFKIGMYTEVSFFENSIVLPTILHNPLDGHRTLNRGSGFYYGLGMPYNMTRLNPKSNMKPYSAKTKMFNKPPPVHELYQLNISHHLFLLNLMIEPSAKMIRRGNVLQYYLEPGDPYFILQRNWNKPLPLGKAPVNLGVYFDLHNFAAGTHKIGFQLFINNDSSAQSQKAMSTIGQWYYRVITSNLFAPQTQRSLKPIDPPSP